MKCPKLKFRRSKEWKRKRAKFIKKKKRCYVCGSSKVLVPAHKNQMGIIEFNDEKYPYEIYNSELYLTGFKIYPKILKRKMFSSFMKWYKNFDISCLLLCKKCHFKQTLGQVICKKCGKEFHESKFKGCFNCYKKLKGGKS